MRERIYQLVQSRPDSDRTSRLYDIFIVIVAFVSLVPIIANTFDILTAWKGPLDIVEVITVYILFFDYLLRWMTNDYKTGKFKWTSFVKYPFTPVAIVTLLSLLPSITPIPSSFAMLRLLRIVLLFRYSKSVKIMGTVIFREKKMLVSTLIVAFIFIFSSALLIYQIEPGMFSNYAEAFIWAIAMNNSGIDASSFAGKLLGVTIYIFGLAIVMMPAGIIIGGYTDEIRRTEMNLKEAPKSYEVFKGRSFFSYKNPIDFFKDHRKVSFYMVVMAAGVLMNFLFSSLATYANMPIWLDTVGTALVAFALEPAAGIIVGFINNCILAMQLGSTSAILFVGVSIITALAFGIAVSHKKPLTLKRISTAGIVVVFIGGGLSSLLTWVLQGGIPTLALDNSNMQMFMSWGIPHPVALYMAYIIGTFINNVCVALLVILLYSSARKPLMQQRVWGDEDDEDDIDETVQYDLYLGVWISDQIAHVTLFSDREPLGRKSLIVDNVLAAYADNTPMSSAADNYKMIGARIMLSAMDLLDMQDQDYENLQLIGIVLPSMSPNLVASQLDFRGLSEMFPNARVEIITTEDIMQVSIAWYRLQEQNPGVTEAVLEGFARNSNLDLLDNDSTF